MISLNNIHPPKNWQDFEMLCLKLWGELWGIPHEIEFNSDNAQGQQGVDIYGPVNGGKQYNGIQCKNKKLHLIDGSPNRLTTSDVQQEIDKAKLFKPALNKLIIATSLPKDQKIEEYIRVQSAAHAQAGLFTIQVCFWDFFERKIPEQPKVYDWYLKNQNFHRIGSAEVLFSGGAKDILYQPKFQKTIHRYVYPIQKPNLSPTMEQVVNKTVSLETFLQHRRSNHLINLGQAQQAVKYDWDQLLWFKLQIQNTGQRVIEDFKLLLSFTGDFVEVGPESRFGIEAQRFSTDVKQYSNTARSLWINPKRTLIVQKDTYTTGSIFLQPSIAAETKVNIAWQLLARDFEDSGEMNIEISPVYHTTNIIHEVKDAGEQKQVVTFGLIQRPGSRNLINGEISFWDKDSDYQFSK